MLWYSLAPEGSDDGVRHTVFRRVYGVAIGFQCLRKRWPCMVRVTVVDDHVLRVARLGKRHNFVVAGVRRKGELVDFEVDLRHGAVNLQATGVEQGATSAPTRLVARQQDGVARIVP